MAEASDIELIRQFVRDRSEAAFARLVERHVNLVYSVACRFTRNAADAQDVAQAVFIILAKKADRISERTVLTGWLYEATRFTAIRHLRNHARRQACEKEALMESNLTHGEPADTWRELEPHLEAAMARLAERDRTLLALRYFENKTGAEAAALLGIREDAAHKRTARALEKLRLLFQRRGIHSTTAVIAAAISTNSLQAAPAGLAGSIAAGAAGSAAAGGSTAALVKGALKIMAWTKAKMAIVVGAGILLATGATTVTVHAIHQHSASEWQLGQIGIGASTPHETVILPTRASEREPKLGTGGSVSVVAGPFLAINSPADDIVRAAYSLNGNTVSPVRVLSDIVLPAGHFDALSNLPQKSREALQQEVRRKFGVVGAFESVETNVLFLRVSNGNAHGLKPGDTKVASSSSSPGEITATWLTMEGLAMQLEVSAFKIPIIDQTGLTNFYSYKFKWNPLAGSEARKQALNDQLGLELVEGTAPVEMLRITRAAR